MRTFVATIIKRKEYNPSNKEEYEVFESENETTALEYCRNVIWAENDGGYEDYMCVREMGLYEVLKEINVPLQKWYNDAHKKIKTVAIQKELESLQRRIIELKGEQK
jgi:hypothetical protein